MPGIIDSHTHFDAQITWDPTGPAVAGAGRDDRGDRQLRLHHRAVQAARPRHHDAQPDAGRGHVARRAARRGSPGSSRPFRSTWRSCAAHGSAVNIAAYIGHSSVRTYVMGADASKRAATDAEIAQMQAIVREAMHAGAVGFASSTSPAHNGEGGCRCLRAWPTIARCGRWSGAMGEGGRGVYMLTKGGHTPVPFLESLAADSGRPVMIAALLHNSTNPQAVFDDLDAIAAANARGHRLIGQVSCCPLTMDFTMQSPYPVEGLKSWQPALAPARRRAEAKLADKAFPRRRARRAGDADQLPPVQRRVGQGAGGRARSPARALRAADPSPTSPAAKAAIRST